MSIKISVIVPAYNLAPFIKRSIESLIHQTYENLEIVIVNDGSTDETLQIIEECAKSDNRIISIHQTNSGVTSARLNGVRHATGDYIGFMDGDDIVDSDMYQRLLDNAVKYNADISHCGYKMVFPDRTDYYYNSGILKEQDTNIGLNDLLEGDIVEPGLVNKLYRKELLEKLISEGKMLTFIKNFEDLLMNYYLFSYSSLSVFDDWCPYHYMIRKGSAATSKVNIHKAQDPIIVLETIYKDLQASNLKSIVKKRLLYSKINVATLSVSKTDEDLYNLKKKCQKELRSQASCLWKNKKFSMKERILITLAGFTPLLYNCIHTVYSTVKGTKFKYQIKEEG